MSEENFDDESSELDSAERLLSLIVKLRNTMEHQSERDASNVIGSLPLADTFEEISITVGYSDYIQLVQYFLMLSKRVRSDLELLQLSRESVRARARKKLDAIDNVFSASNFRTGTKNVFNHHFSEANMDMLEDLSDRFLTSNVKENSLKTLNESIDDISDLANFCEESGKLGMRASKIIHLHLNHLKSIIEHYEDFGEADFWDHYAILFSTFMQLHEVVVDEKSKKEFKDKMTKVFNRLVFGSSLTANAITIGVAAVPFLT